MIDFLLLFVPVHQSLDCFKRVFMALYCSRIDNTIWLNNSKFDSLYYLSLNWKRLDRGRWLLLQFLKRQVCPFSNEAIFNLEKSTLEKCSTPIVANTPHSLSSILPRKRIQTKRQAPRDIYAHTEPASAEENMKEEQTLALYTSAAVKTGRRDELFGSRACISRADRPHSGLSRQECPCTCGGGAARERRVELADCSSALSTAKRHSPAPRNLQS